MKSLDIKVPKGFEIDREKSTFEKIIFKEIKKDNINTLDDIFRSNDTTEVEFYSKWRDFENHEIGIALEKLIVKAYNKGEVPKWDDGSYKYYPYFYMDNKNFRFICSGYSCGRSYAPISLCFIREKDLLDAVEKFLDVFKMSRLE